MYRAIAVTDLDRERFRTALPPWALPPEALTRHPPDASWLLTNTADEPVGRCSLWWRSVPTLPGERPGLVGHYAARDAASAAQVLRLACAQLTAHGCTRAIGPMDGNTWQRYRLLTERGSEPPFFLEPDNPDDWPDHFRAAGFAPLAGYSSALDDRLSPDDERADELERRQAERGVRLRGIDPDAFDAELHRVYTVAAASFAGNFLYTPIAEDDFVAQYRPVRPHVRPELVTLAEREGEAVGFVFVVPDLAQAIRGQTVDTVILKTFAVRPECAGHGLGELLARRARRTAARMGFRRFIVALMHDANRSRRISDRFARTIRRYTLFSRPLTPA